VARILITGSAQGLGRAAANTLLDDGHRVVLHARDTHRADTLTDLVDRGAEVVVGNLANAQQTHELADQVNQLGRMDAVIHNAGVYGDSDRNPSPEGHPRVLAVNTLATYLLTSLIERPDRLIYLTSDMHVSGDDSLHDLDWATRRWNGTQAYCDSKLFVTALALERAARNHSRGSNMSLHQSIVAAPCRKSWSVGSTPRSMR
jgi:NAD(P)-dependent dehydrogenase (short-subunit alcohol dehydrogenase family)